MQQPLTTISVSSITDYQNCPARWIFRWIENRVPRSVPSALTVGTILHKAFEDHFSTGEKLDRALLKLIAQAGTFLTEKEAKAIDELSGLVEPLGLWHDEFPIAETLEVEEPFSIPIPRSALLFNGRPDRVAICWDKTFHLQTKSVRAQKDVGLYTDVARRSFHELIYGLYLGKKYHERPYGGSIYSIVKKLKYRSSAKGKTDTILHTPEEMFSQHIIATTLNEQTRAWKEVQVLARAMARTVENYMVTGVMPPSNRSLDAGFYGSSMDPYTPVLMGEASLDDETRFMDRPDLYAPVEVEA